MLIHGVLMLLAVSMVLSCSDRHSDESLASDRQSEIYIRRFKSMFDSLPADKQIRIAKSVGMQSTRLDAALDSARYYKEQKKERIAHIKNRQAVSETDLLTKYADLYDEYIFSSFDSSFVYAHRYKEIADHMSDPDVRARAAIRLSNMYIQGGYFREADHAIYDFDESACSDSMKIQVEIARFNLEFENSFFFGWRLYSPNIARQNMLRLYDIILPKLPDDSFETYYLKMLMAFSNHEFKQAENYGNILLIKTGNNTPGKMKIIGDIGFNKMGYGEFADAMQYMVEEAEHGIRTGSSNYSSLRKIAELEYVVGDVDRAAKYINLAMGNATEYNSKYRIIESSKGYPSITTQLRNKIERDRQQSHTLIIAMLILVVLLTLSVIYIIGQRRKVHEQAKSISWRNVELEQKNKEIQETNRLLEDNRGVTSILVARMVSGIATRRQLIDRMKRELSVKIKSRQYDSMEPVTEKYIKEIASTYLDVDEVLLAFFPDFARQFNELLREECRFDVRKGYLTVEMRIFALWRIGIKKNEDIANCLQYSLNTIKSYKTRVLNASLYSKDEFYKRLMEISIVTA